MNSNKYLISDYKEEYSQLGKRIAILISNKYFIEANQFNISSQFDSKKPILGLGVIDEYTNFTQDMQMNNENYVFKTNMKKN